MSISRQIEYIDSVELESNISRFNSLIPSFVDDFASDDDDDINVVYDEGPLSPKALGDGRRSQNDEEVRQIMRFLSLERIFRSINFRHGLFLFLKS